MRNPDSLQTKTLAAPLFIDFSDVQIRLQFRALNPIRSIGLFPRSPRNSKSMHATKAFARISNSRF